MRARLFPHMSAPFTSADITCPRCRCIYDDTLAVDPAHPDARFPVQLVPCGHTCCRPCVRAHWSAAARYAAVATPNDSPPGPCCPLCNYAIAVTRFDEHALALVRSASHTSASVTGAALSTVNAPATAAAAPVAHDAGLDAIDAMSFSASLGPLDPALRAQLLERCRPGEAQRAEHVARGVGTLRRAIDFSKAEFDAALGERDGAGEAVAAKAGVVTTLQGELRVLDEKLKQLHLDRQVVLHQLQGALGEHNSASRYQSECEMRLLEIQRRMQAEATELDNRIGLLHQLAPGVAL